MVDLPYTSKQHLVGGLQHFFSRYWEFYNPNCYSLHDFSEGQVQTTNQTSLAEAQEITSIVMVYLRTQQSSTRNGGWSGWFNIVNPGSGYPLVI